MLENNELKILYITDNYLSLLLGSTTSCDCSGTRPIDSYHVGHCPTPGTEADVGRAFVPSHLNNVPRPGRQDHRHVARNR